MSATTTELPLDYRLRPGNFVTDPDTGRKVWSTDLELLGELGLEGLDPLEHRPVVIAGYDGGSNPIRRYSDELDLPEHERASVYMPEVRERDATSYSRPSSARVFLFRARVDGVVSNPRLADDLELRARALRETPELPMSERRTYAGCLWLVETSTVGLDDWSKARLARRIWQTGEAVFHASWVLFGSQDGRGCGCNSTECSERRADLER